MRLLKKHEHEGRLQVKLIKLPTRTAANFHFIGLDAKSMFLVIPNIPSPANDFLKDSHNLGQAS